MPQQIRAVRFQGNTAYASAINNQSVIVQVLLHSQMGVASDFNEKFVQVQ